MFANEQGGLSRPRKLLSVLKAAKTQQDLSSQPNRGRGLWLSSKLWHTITKHLEQQAVEMDELQNDLEQKAQETEQLRQQAAAEREAQQRVIEKLEAQAAQLQAAVASPLAELGSLQAQMRAKQEAWDTQRHDLETQVDRLMELLRTMGLFSGSGAVVGGEDGAARARKPGNQPKPEFELTAPDAQALRIRELSLLLSEARQRAESYRQQLAARTTPQEELRHDNKRLQADNRRLVALLDKVPEYRAFAAEVASEAGVHYLPLEECLMIRGQVEDLYPQMLDRPVEEVTGSDLAGPGRRRDPDGPDTSLTAVLDEQYHWVPRKAVELGVALMRRVMPALPTSQLMALVAELNKVWRDRERQRLAEVASVHREELRKLQHTFQQRAPYEAVVAGQKINDLKRRIRAQAAQAEAAAAAAKGEQRRNEDDSKVLLHAGLRSIQDLSRQVTRLLTRNKKLANKVAKQRARAAAKVPVQTQPVCSACLERLLQPNAVPVRIPALDLPGLLQEPALQHQEQQLLQQQQQQQYRRVNIASSETSATRRRDLPPAGEAAATAAATAVMRQYRQQQDQPPQMPPGAAASLDRREAVSHTGALTGYSHDDLYDTSGRYPYKEFDSLHGGAGPGSRDGGGTLEAAEVVVRGLGAAGGARELPAPLEPYGASGPPVQVNVTAPSAPARWPREAAAELPQGPLQPAVAGGVPLAGPLTLAAGPLDGPHASCVGGRVAPAALQLESAKAGLSSTAPGSVLVRQADGGNPGGVAAAATATTVPPGATAEFSTASLGDWRGAATGGGWYSEVNGAAGDADGGPLTVKVNMGPGSPCRSVTILSAAPGSGVGGTAAPQLQTRGTPVKVCVRFPRQDIATAPAAH